MSIGQIVRYGTTAHSASEVVTWEEQGDPVCVRRASSRSADNSARVWVHDHDRLVSLVGMVSNTPSTTNRCKRAERIVFASTGI
jgi:hypothetical protein